MRLEIIIAVLIIIICIIYFNLDKLSISEMVVITISLALFMHKTEVYKAFLVDDVVEPPVVSKFTKSPINSGNNDEELIKIINDKVKPLDEFDQIAIKNQDKNKKLQDELREATGNYDGDAVPIIPLIKQKAFAAEAANIRSAGYNIHSVRKFYDEELDKSYSSNWVDVNNEMDDKMYEIHVDKLTGSR
jgi:hypothetical protein